MLRLLFVWLFFSAPLMAEELSLRGFYTVGVNWVDSDVDWDTYKYISRFDNQANITEYTRLGLNLSAPLTDYWTFYGQVLAQQYDDDADALRLLAAQPLPLPLPKTPHPRCLLLRLGFLKVAWFMR